MESEVFFFLGRGQLLVDGMLDSSGPWPQTGAAEGLNRGAVTLGSDSCWRSMERTFLISDITPFSIMNVLGMNGLDYLAFQTLVLQLFFFFF